MKVKSCARYIWRRESAILFTLRRSGCGIYREILVNDKNLTFSYMISVLWL